MKKKRCSFHLGKYSLDLKNKLNCDILFINSIIFERTAVMEKFIKDNHKFIIAIIVVTVIWLSFAYNTISTNVQTKEELIRLESSSSLRYIDLELSNIFTDIQIIETFVTTVGISNITTEKFNEFASAQQFHEEGFVSLSIAPNGIIEYYYSELFDDDLIIGQDLLHDERIHVREAVEYAIENNVIVTNGPFDLLLGDQGLVFRKPLYEGEQFIAIINYVIDFDVFYGHLNKFDSPRIFSAIYDSNRNLIFGVHEYTENIEVFEKIDLEYVDWHIGIQASDSYLRTQVLINSFLGAMFTVLLIAVWVLWSFYYFRNKDLHKTQNQLIYYDILSNLPNRLLFEEETQALIYNRTPFFLGFGDLDNFKNINDVLGHSVGDQYLSFVATHLKTLVSENLRVYRWGGDEFIFIFINTSKEELHGVMDRIFNIFRTPFEVKDTKHHISISIGVVEYPKDGLNIDDLVKRADIVMYDIKSQHKNTYSFFEKRYLENLYNQLEFQQTLDKYEVDDFDVYLQPIIDVESGELKGFEGLARLFDENGKQFPTHEIIKLFEQDGTITKLDKYIFRTICKYISECTSVNRDEFFFTFNISPLSLTREYVEYLERTVHSFNINPESIIIEIIETLGFKDVRISIELLDMIKRIGFKIAMDDFGMGYSSLSYITKLPLDLIKIDKSFIHDYEHNTFNRTILNTIKDISNSLHLDILVEGIETESQLEFIKGLKAQYYQGYYHSKPMSFKAAKKFIEKAKK